MARYIKDARWSMYASPRVTTQWMELFMSYSPEFICTSYARLHVRLS